MPLPILIGLGAAAVAATGVAIATAVEEEEKKKRDHKKKHKGSHSKEDQKKEEEAAKDLKYIPKKKVIAVVGTMSSGKSTLLNAMLGRQLLPVSNMACTANVIRILNNKQRFDFMATFRRQGDSEDTVMYHVDADKLKEYNQDYTIQQIQIKGNIQNINNNAYMAELIDTPGPNNAMNSAHSEVTMAMLEAEDVDLYIYVLNVTQLAIADDAELLREVIQSAYNSEKDILFVLNKCDELDTEDGETIEKLMESATAYIEKHGVISPQIIPVSALMAQLIRRKTAHDILTKKEQIEVQKYVEEPLDNLAKYSKVPASILVKIHKKYNTSVTNNNSEMQALISTGVPTLETYIESIL